MIGDDMNLLDITINGKKYTYVDNITIDGHNYIAYSDEEFITISEYTLINDELQLSEIDDETFNKVKEAMKL